MTSSMISFANRQSAEVLLQDKATETAGLKDARGRSVGVERFHLLALVGGLVAQFLVDLLLRLDSRGCRIGVPCHLGCHRNAVRHLVMDLRSEANRTITTKSRFFTSMGVIRIPTSWLDQPADTHCHRTAEPGAIKHDSKRSAYLLLPHAS